MDDLASEIQKKQAQIDEFTKANKKSTQNVEYSMKKKIEEQSEQQPEESKQAQQVEQPEESKTERDEQQPVEASQDEGSGLNAEEVITDTVKDEEEKKTGGDIEQTSQQ